MKSEKKYTEKCVICGKLFSTDSLHKECCSKECNTKYHNMKRTTCELTYADIRRARFEQLLRYAEKNNIRKLAEKYRNKTNAND